jgi:hypothetical protein
MRGSQLEHGKLVVLFDVENAQRQADVVVEILRAAAAFKGRAERGIQHFARRRLADAPRDPDHQRVHALAVRSGKVLQSFQDIGDDECRHVAGDRLVFFNDTSNGPTADRICNEVMSVVLFALERPKQVTRLGRPRVGRHAIKHDIGGVGGDNPPSRRGL